MAHFPPVFHNFFLERFPQPSAWFTARTAYTRSTAVNSMAGAVIGLGDRHLNNVLVDLATAEVGLCFVLLVRAAAAQLQVRRCLLAVLVD